MKKILIAWVTLLCAPSAAWAQALPPQASYNAGMKYCGAEYIAQECQNLAVGRIFSILANVGFKTQHPSDWSRGCAAGRRDAKKVKVNNGIEILCVTGIVLYGPNGVNVKNMLVATNKK
ncbi:MAG: hypothetical protein DSY80_00530 [Desulfocapsa sp.]|nr:MAG: hypothetical protein DSY80_00530 [Desulfocapsa sp.]